VFRSMSIVNAALTTAVASIWFLLLAGNASANPTSAVDHSSYTADREALSHSCTWRATQARFVLLSIVSVRRRDRGQQDGTRGVCRRHVSMVSTCTMKSQGRAFHSSLCTGDSEVGAAVRCFVSTTCQSWRSTRTSLPLTAGLPGCRKPPLQGIALPSLWLIWWRCSTTWGTSVLY